MLKSSTLSCPNTMQPQWSKYYALTLKAFTSVFMFFALLFSTTASAQSLPTCTKGGRTYLPHCTSNDLSVVSASLKADQCNCSNGDQISASIVMTLYNKTGSERTSFAFFAILVQTDPKTGVETKSYITGCTGPVAAGSSPIAEFPDPKSGDPKYTFKCGNSLKLTQVYLAWTDASDGSTRQCPLSFCDIAPKCGTPADITINPLLSADASGVEACQGVSDGKITVSGIGGKTPYTYSIDGTNYQSNATFTGLAAKQYTCYVKDAADCIASKNFTLTDKPCCVKPPKPTVCEIPASICPSGSDGKVTVRITNAVVGDKYYFTQSGTTTSSTATSTTLEFKGDPGKGFEVYGEDVVGTATCTGDKATCSDLSGTCAAGLTKAAVPSSEVQKVQNIDARITSAKTSVLAAPNPFSDKVRFTLQSDVSGQGSLELYNLMGQKVATVYRGYVEAGKPLSKEYSVQKATRANLIYVFRVGDQKTTGKLLNW